MGGKIWEGKPVKTLVTIWVSTFERLVANGAVLFMCPLGIFVGRFFTVIGLRIDLADITSGGGLDFLGRLRFFGK